MPANSEKEHLSIVICGHVDSGKSTTTGRLIFELGGLPERELEKLTAEAERLGNMHLAAYWRDPEKHRRRKLDARAAQRAADGPRKRPAAAIHA